MNTTIKTNEKTRCMDVQVDCNEVIQTWIKTNRGHDLHIVFQTDGTLRIVDYCNYDRDIVIKTHAKVKKERFSLSKKQVEVKE